MVATELISSTLGTLHPDNTGEEALTMMRIYYVKHLPLVKNGQLLAIISEDDILNHDLDLVLSSYNFEILMPLVHVNDHLLDIIGKMAAHDLTTIAVLNDDNEYIGLIHQEDLLQYYANHFSINEPGGILVIETDSINYSLSEISKIIESENTAILSSHVSKSGDSTKIEVTLKLNKKNLQEVIAALIRYGYNVTATFVEEPYLDNFKERYDGLMKYLSV